MLNRVLAQLHDNGVNPKLQLIGVIMTMYDGRTKLSQQVASEVREHFGDRVFETMIPRATRLAEAPSFGKGTVNIGDRQQGRLKAHSVIDCDPEQRSIASALEKLYSPAFQTMLASVRNPYGTGGASEKVVDVLRDYPLEPILKKPFHDLE